MTTQTTLFALNSEPTVAQAAAEARKLARGSDPESSKLAAEHMVNSGAAKLQRERCVDLVWMRPGHTSQELVTGDLTRDVLTRRLPEAERLGQVKKGPMRKCKVTGRQAHVWLPGDDA